MKDEFAARLVQAVGAAAGVCGNDAADASLDLADRLGIGRFVRFRITAPSRGEEAAGERILLELEERLRREAAEELSAAFTKRGIRHFFVKGVALAGTLYERGERAMSDIDVHIVPSARKAAEDTLESLGYEVPCDADQSAPRALRSGLFAGRYSGTSHLEHVALDLAWGVDPVDRLLPRADRAVPDLVWDGLDCTGPFPVPDVAHHVVLLVHHLVHHDMLHFLGLVDLALLWPLAGESAVPELEDLARQLGVLRTTRLLADILRRDFDVDIPPLGAAPSDWRGRRARRMLDPVRWCRWASGAEDAEFVEINLPRIRRRLLLLDDIRSGAGLLADAIVPPPEYLRWRWPEAGSTAAAWFRHFTRVIGKVA